MDIVSFEGLGYLLLHTGVLCCSSHEIAAWSVYIGYAGTYVKGSME